MVAGQVGSIAGGLVGVRVLTSLLGPNEYGLLALALTLATLCQQVAFSPLAGAALRFYAPACQAGTTRAFWAALRGSQIRLSVGVAMLAVVAITPLALVGGAGWIALGLLALAYAVGAGMTATGAAVMTAARRRTVTAAMQAAGEWLRFIAAATALVLIARDSRLALAGYVVAGAGIGWFHLAWARRHLALWPPSDDAPHGAGTDRRVRSAGEWAQMIRTYAWPFVLWGGFTWAQLVSDRWALALFGSAADVGRYAVVFQLGYHPVSLAGTLATQLLAPVVFQRAGDGSDPARLADARRWIGRVAIASLALLLVGVGVAHVMHGWVFTLLLAPEFRAASRYWPAMLLAGGLFSIGQIVSLLPLARGDSRVLLAPKIGTAVAGVAFNIVGAWWAGLGGVVAAGVAFSLFYLTWSSWLAHRVSATSRG